MNVLDSLYQKFTHYSEWIRDNVQSMSFDKRFRRIAAHHKNDKSTASSDPTKASTFWEIRFPNSRDWVFLRVRSLRCKLRSRPLLFVLRKRMRRKVGNSKPTIRFSPGIPQNLTQSHKIPWNPTNLKSHAVPVVSQRRRLPFPVFQKSHSWNKIIFKLKFFSWTFPLYLMLHH